MAFILIGIITVVGFAYVWVRHKRKAATAAR